MDALYEEMAQKLKEYCLEKLKNFNSNVEHITLSNGIKYKIRISETNREMNPESPYYGVLYSAKIDIKLD
jgi:hypothetical protein